MKIRRVVHRNLEWLGTSMCRSLSLAWLLVFSAAAASVELSEQMSFQNILSNRDIAPGEISAIYQDHAGFMWFGGASFLTRFNGYEFEEIPLHIRNDAGEEITQPLKFAQHMFEDNNGHLWVSSRFGVHRFNFKLDKLESIPDSPEVKTQLSSADIHDAVMTADDKILLASMEGLILLDTQSNDYAMLRPRENSDEAEKAKRTYSLLKDDNNIIWVGTESGLEKLDWSKQTFTQIPLTQPGNQNALSGRVTDIEKDKRGILWLGTPNGLIRFDPGLMQAKRFDTDSQQSHAILSNEIWDVFIDSNEIPWLATDGGGVAAYDEERDRFYNYTNDPLQAKSLSTKAVRVVYEDRNGDLWTGNYPDGINFHDRSSNFVKSFYHEPGKPTSLSNSSVTSVVEDKHGNFWLGTDGGGLNKYKRSSGEFESFQFDPNNVDTPSSNAVLSVMIDNQGILWCGTWGGGFFSFDPESGRAKRFPFTDAPAKQGMYQSDALHSTSVWDIRKDGDTKLWLSTHFGGLSLYDLDKKIFTHWSTHPAKANAISTNLIWGTYTDSENNFWLATVNGVELFDKDKNFFIHHLMNPNDPFSLSHHSVLSLYEDKNKRFWVGTGAGLNQMNRRTKRFERITKAEGLNDDTIRDIVEDDEGRLWLSTNSGVSIYQPNSGDISNLKRANGRLIGGFHTGSGLKSSKGEIVFGGFKGLRVYEPNELGIIDNETPVVLTNLFTDRGRELPGAKGGVLSDSIRHAKALVLPHGLKRFAVEFAALNYRSPQQVHYAYKLEGFDRDWVNAGKERRATYTNLDAGNYRFVVRASDAQGNWRSDTATILVRQKAAWWNTGWAKLFYIATFLLLLVYLYSWQRRIFLQEKVGRRQFARELEDCRESLKQKDRDLQAILDNSTQGILSVGEDGVILEDHSQSLEIVFKTRDISGRHVVDFLFLYADLSTETLTAMRTAILAIVGEDEMNFDFNASVLVRECHLDIQGEGVNLDIQWYPIVHDSIVEKLLVIVQEK